MAWTSNPSHFRVFRFLFGRGTDVHLPSQENEIQPISQQPTSVSKFIICLFRHAGTSRDVPTCTFFIVDCEICIKRYAVSCEFCLLKRIFEKTENSY